MFRSLVLAVAFGLSAMPARAETGSEVSDLYDALGLSRIIAVMRIEGIEYGESIEEQLFPGRGGAAWSGLVSDIYAIERLETVVLENFGAELEGTDLSPLLDFFGSERGQRIIDLEVTAREALLEPDVEAAAEAALPELQSGNPERFALLERFVEANDLVESNVMGAMNSNYAFYMGLIDGGALGDEMTEDQVLVDVWAQEAEIRNDTEGWVYSYLGLAYQPLSDEDIEAYIALSRTEEGRALNAALFAAFDVMYTGISRDLGAGAARFLVGQDI